MSVAATSSTSSSLALSGLASGLNWTAIINDMVQAEQAPETQMESQQTTLGQQNSAYKTINTDLTTLGNDVTTLMAAGFFNSRTASASDPSVASATAAQGTPVGSYSFNFTHLATDAVQQGTTVAARPLSPTDDVSSLVLSSAAFATPVAAGTFTVNGQIITISTSDTLQSVFDQINSATDGAVTASYSSSADQISLASSSPMVLGSATDTSNFLQAAQLYNNGKGAITSASPLGAINLNNPISSSKLASAIGDGGNGKGEFIINGVAINFDASTDSINEVLQRINDSAAGVTATFNGVNHQFQLTNKTTGDVGISLQDVTGNFLAATGLSGGKLQSGNNLIYSINDSSPLTSQSNTIDASSSGLTGLSVTALGTGPATITVQSDTSTISSAINQFVTDYNAAQNYISSQTASTTNSAGTVTPGLLTGDINVEGIATTLRQLTDASPGRSSAAIHSLNDMGITSNGTDNTLAVNSTTLNEALTNNLDAVNQLFTNPASGLGTTLAAYLTNTTGSNGVIASQEANLTQQSKSIATSITTLQKKITNDETNLQNEFVAMETAISSINSQKQYLQAYFGDQSAANVSLSGTGASGSVSSGSTSSSG